MTGDIPQSDSTRRRAGKLNPGDLAAMAQLTAEAQPRGPRIRRTLRQELTARGDVGITPVSFRTDGAEPLVSVVMPVWNGTLHVEDAIRSVLKQTYSNLELIIVDDSSDDGTPEVVESLQRSDERIRLFRSYRNRGPYWSKNLGIRHAQGPYVALHDADDESHPERIAVQVLSLLSMPGAIGSYVLGERVDPQGKVVPQRGRRARRAYPSLMFDKEFVNRRVGFFDSVKIAADDEFHNRLKLRLPPGSIVDTRRVLYRLLIREDSLTAQDEVALKEAPPADGVRLSRQKQGLSHLSSTRRQYVFAYRDWHRRSPDPYVSFPQQGAAFQAPKRIQADIPADWWISASIASIPSRQLGLERVVRGILPQVDRLFVYLNGYGSVPDFLRHPRISVATSQDHGDKADNGKFYCSKQFADGYHLTLDDDINYPPDYAMYCIAKCQQFDDRAIIGFHGTIFDEELHRFFNPDTRTTFSFSHNLPEDHQVHLLGTGTVAYPTDILTLDSQMFPTTGMVDLWLAIAAQNAEVPMIAVARPERYLSEMVEFREGSLYQRFRHNDGLQTGIAKQIQPWRMPPI